MVEITTYQEIVDILEKNKEDEQRNHLFLGNGFNYSLNVNTSYKNIFKKMVKCYKDYENIEHIIEEEGYDIEVLLESLAYSSIKTFTEDKIELDFIKTVTKDKIKLDFIKATYSIVDANKHNLDNGTRPESLRHLFQLCDNYFTLNFDPLVYLSLIKFKKKDIITFSKTFKYKEKTIEAGHYDYSTQQEKVKLPLAPELQEILDETRKIKENYRRILINNRNEKEYSKLFKDMTIGELKIHLKEILKDKYGDLQEPGRTPIIDAVTHDEKDMQEEIKEKTIKETPETKVIDEAWKDDINDGFLKSQYHESPKQNLFYLHGAFHIYQKENTHHKIIRSKEESFNSQINDIITEDNNSMVCVFDATKEDKIRMIKNDKYLKFAHQALGQLTGSLLVIGCAFSDNDNHIVDRINQSEIKHIYISHYIEERDSKTDHAIQIEFEEREKELKEKFPQFNVTIFDADTIFKER